MNLQLYIKRIFDLIGSLVGLIIFAVSFLIIAILIKFTSKDPVFFKQFRPDRNGKLFRLYKFRTMNDLRDNRGNLLLDEKRLTKIGKFLRRLNLDEKLERTFEEVIKCKK